MAQDISTVIESVRGANPLQCELMARSIENQWGWWGSQDIRGTRDPQVRASLTLISQRKTDEASVPALRAAVADGDACVRRVAAPLLGRIGHPGALTALRSLLRDENPLTREAAAFGLGYSGDSAVIPALLSGLQDNVPRVRIASAWALGEIEDRRALAALVRVLREDRDAEVRAAAAWAIGEIAG